MLESGHTMKTLYGEYCKVVEVQFRRALPATQQPCPYRLTSQLRRQYALLNVPTPDPMPPVPHKVSYPIISYCVLVQYQWCRCFLKECENCASLDKFRDEVMQVFTEKHGR